MAGELATKTMAVTPLRCPRRHADWETGHRTGDYYCNSCRERFDELLDMREVGA